jgi:hypothetical protein
MTVHGYAAFRSMVKGVGIAQHRMATHDQHPGRQKR